MSEIIADGTGKGHKAKVTKDNRQLGEVISEPIASERSRSGKLWGLGTGSISVNSGMTLGSVLWFKNNYSDQDIYVEKIIYGWNGGTASRNVTCFNSIHYNTDEPGANRASASPQIENIGKSGTSSPVTDSDVTAWKWDGTGTLGMTDTGGGFAQIPNRVAIGDTEKPIDGQIILAPGNSMEMRVIPEEDGLFQVSVVYYTAKANVGRSGE